MNGVRVSRVFMQRAPSSQKSIPTKETAQGQSTHRKWIRIILSPVCSYVSIKLKILEPSTVDWVLGIYISNLTWSFIFGGRRKKLYSTDVAFIRAIGDS
jgi:hypothetical protein